jgi:2-(1,2-epoxy-1,2-dihydrophenyl)acetyl-CoA isomerase
MSESRHVRIDIIGAVGVLTLDRRERFNSFDVETARDFREAGLRLARDAAVRAVVVRGVAGVFSSGADLKYIRDGGDGDGLSYLRGGADGAASLGAAKPTPGAVFKQILEYLHSTISEIRRAPKPFIAAVDGIAAAGGFGIAMACDLVFASERASFEWAYGRTGLTGAESSTFLLPRLVGLRQAMALLFLNPRLDARAARDAGLVNEVVAVERLDAEVMEVAQRLAAGPTAAYGVAKGLINRAAGIDRLDYHLDQELESLVRSADSAEFAEGMSAFFEKRPPEYQRVEEMAASAARAR